MSQDISTTCIEEIWQEFPGYSQYEVRSALAKCGLTTKHIESLVKVLSGGEQAKVRLCKLINRPSNAVSYTHLDVYKRQYFFNIVPLLKFPVNETGSRTIVSLKRAPFRA